MSEFNSFAEFERRIREEAQRDGISRLVLAAIVETAEREVLLLRRAADDFLGDLWELPSGRLDPGESIKEGLTRELAEETNLALTAVTGFFGTFDYLSRSGKKTRQINLAVSVGGNEVVLNLAEHSDWNWTDRLATGDMNISQKTLGILEKVWQGTHCIAFV